MNPPSPSVPTRPLRVFVVENHSDTLKYLRLYLESLGHEVSAALTMKAALAALPGAGCDVLISDIGLPDGTGWELLERLAGRPGLPAYAIAMSGFGLNADQERSRAVGFRHHLLKPFPPDRIGSLLDEATRELAAGEPGGAP